MQRACTILLLLAAPLFAEPPLPPWSPTPQQAATIEGTDGHIGVPTFLIWSGGTTNELAIASTNMPPPVYTASDKPKGGLGKTKEGGTKASPDPRYVVTAYSSLAGEPVEVTIRVSGDHAFFKAQMEVE